MNKADLKLDWCSHEAAKYAVEHWHYSGTMPIGKVAKVGVWELGEFIGVVLFSTGASPQLHKVFGVTRFEVAELVRVALREHASAVTRVIAIAIRMLKAKNPGLRVLVSFADPEEGHIGGIYQGGNWVYCGRSAPGLYYRTQDGKVTHNRNLAGPEGFRVNWNSKEHQREQKRYGEQLRSGLADGSIQRVVMQPKYKYAMPLDAEMQRQIEPLRKPYPKRAGSAGSGTPGDQPGGGGANPTSALCVQDGKG